MSYESLSNVNGLNKKENEMSTETTEAQDLYFFSESSTSSTSIIPQHSITPQNIEMSHEISLSMDNLTESINEISKETNSHGRRKKRRKRKKLRNNILIAKLYKRKKLSNKVSGWPKTGTSSDGFSKNLQDDNRELISAEEIFNNIDTWRRPQEISYPLICSNEISEEHLCLFRTACIVNNASYRPLFCLCNPNVPPSVYLGLLELQRMQRRALRNRQRRVAFE